MNKVDLIRLVCGAVVGFVCRLWTSRGQQRLGRLGLQRPGLQKQVLQRPGLQRLCLQRLGLQRPSLQRLVWGSTPRSGIGLAERGHIELLDFCLWCYYGYLPSSSTSQRTKSSPLAAWLQVLASTHRLAINGPHPSCSRFEHSNTWVHPAARLLTACFTAHCNRQAAG